MNVIIAGAGIAGLSAACSGHGYKFGAAVGRHVVALVETPVLAGLVSWLRAEAP